MTFLHSTQRGVLNDRERNRRVIFFFAQLERIGMAAHTEHPVSRSDAIAVERVLG